MASKDSEKDDILAEAKDMFGICQDAEDTNRRVFEEDTLFYKGGEEQWPADVLSQRRDEGRPAVTINKIPAFCRQVTNDARQNKPSIKIHPADSGADPETAKIVQELIRNIEVTSNADVAYDTAAENAVRGGWGFIKVDLDQAYNDTHELDLKIKRVANPLSIYADPYSTEADSSDWMMAFDVDRIPKRLFERDFPKATVTDWSADVWTKLGQEWITEDLVTIARYWKREPTTKKVAIMSDGTTIPADTLMEMQEDLGVPLIQVLATMGITPVREAEVKSYKVTRYTLTGAEVVETHDWPGCYIPIVPVYGNELWVDGKRYLTSLHHDAKDAQMNYNYWQSAATQMAAMQTVSPWIGEEGTFDIDPDKWATSNARPHGYIEWAAGKQPPIKVPPTAFPAAEMQMATVASDDMKAIMGLYDASLGNRSNETSGIAINARKQQGDISTFNFQDNVSRGIRCLGMILLDLIPHVFQGERIIRVMGEDNKARNVQLGKPTPVLDDRTGQPQEDPNNPGMPLTRIYDLTAGKYDLTVETGPSFATRREEASASMIELIKAFPMAAPVVGPKLARAMDWPGAEEIADDLEKLAPGPDALPPEVQQHIQETQDQLQKLQAENQKLNADNVKLSADAHVAKAGQQLAQMEATKAQLVQPEGPTASPIELETERIKKEAARLTALAAYYSAETKIADVANPPQQTPPDPLQMEAHRNDLEAKRTASQASLIKAKADYHVATGMPVEPPPPPPPVKPKRKSISVNRGPDGKIAGAEVIETEDA